jgi:recombinational DNA repair protein RecR
MYVYKGIKICKSKTPIICQEYKRHNNCTKCNNNAREKLEIIISRVNINTSDKFIQ